MPVSNEEKSEVSKKLQKVVLLIYFLKEFFEILFLLKKGFFNLFKIKFIYFIFFSK